MRTANACTEYLLHRAEISRLRWRQRTGFVQQPCSQFLDVRGDNERVVVVNCDRDVRLGCIQGFSARDLQVVRSQSQPSLVLFRAPRAAFEVVTGDEGLGNWKLEWDLTASSYLRTLFSGHGLGGSPFCVFSLSFSRLTDSRVYFLSFLSLHRRIGDAVAFDRVAEDHHVAPGTSYCAG